MKVVYEKEELLEKLSELPYDSDPKFTEDITQIITSSESIIEDQLIDILKSSDNQRLRFNAFYGLAVYYRRYKLTSKLEKLTGSYSLEFKTKPLYKFIMSTIYATRVNQTSYQLALEYAEEAIEGTDHYPGFYNNYTEIVAKLLEEEIQVMNVSAILEKAYTYINKAIMINPEYAKYYANLGRIQYLSGEFKESKMNILKAIDIEDNTKKDYAIRIADYQYYLLKCNSKESITKLEALLDKKSKELTDTTQHLEKSFKDEKVKFLEFLVFFTGIITFIVSTVQITSGNTFNDAVKIIIVLLGALLIAFGTLRMLIEVSKTSFMITGVFTLIGFIVIGAGYFI